MNELDRVRDYFALKGAEARIMDLELKHFPMPEDIPAWLDAQEIIVKQLPAYVLEGFEKEIKNPLAPDSEPLIINDLLQRIADARYQHSLGNMTKLKRMIYLIYRNMENADDDLNSYDKKRYKIDKKDETLKRNSDEQAIWRDRAPILRAKMAELREARPKESYSYLYERLKKFTKERFGLEIGLSSAKKYAPDPSPRPRKNNRLGL